MASLDQFLQDLDDLDDEQAEGADEEVQDEEVDEDEDIDMMGEDVQPASTSGLLASGLAQSRCQRLGRIAGRQFTATVPNRRYLLGGCR